MIEQLLSIFCATLVGLSTSLSPKYSGNQPSFTPKYTIKLTGTPVWNSINDVKEATNNKVKIVSNVIDLQGGCLDGSNLKKSSNSQNESNTPIRLYLSNYTLKNGYIVNIPGGIVVQVPNVTIENILFTGVSEDYISNIKDKSYNFKILNCKFYNNSKGDKSCQINGAVGLIVKDCYITGGITAIRIGESTSTKHGSAKVENCSIENVSTFLNIDGKTQVFVKNNTLKNVDKKYVIKKGSAVRE
jgi:hypothetical protein